MDAVIDTIKAQLVQLRSKLDDIPALQKLEVSKYNKSWDRKQRTLVVVRSHYFVILAVSREGSYLCASLFCFRRRVASSRYPRPNHS